MLAVMVLQIILHFTMQKITATSSKLSNNDFEFVMAVVERSAAAVAGERPAGGHGVIPARSAIHAVTARR